ncbi:MAG: hypothetical protein ACFFAK_12000 [Promethearchaeota archaeon]
MKGKNLLSILLMVSLTVNIMFFIGFSNNPPIAAYTEKEGLSSSSLGYHGLINNIFNKKLGQFGEKGYFSQIYEPSIQATYYTLEILDKLDRLDEINTTQITEFIMAFYQSDENLFIDNYAKRWLESDPHKEIIYPLSSLLEINCYAVLSLKILGKLDLIDSQSIIDFIWDCYNPVGHGFIGKQFDISLPPYLKLTTMDNTFYAIKVIDILDNWDLYTQVKNNIIDYIVGLQATGSHPDFFGGFFNDDDFIISSLKFNDPNLLSAYYCLKSLELFNQIDSININNFYLYLNRLYNPSDYHFYFSAFCKQHNELDVIGSALALELAYLTGYSNYSKVNVSQFIFNNRNSWGIWEQSTNIQYHELIDTFQILRSLEQVGELSRLNSIETDMIVASLEKYFYLDGFALLSEDYTSLQLLYSLINAYDDKINEFPISQLYQLIESACYYDYAEDGDMFISCTNMNFDSIIFRSFPVEYYSYGIYEIGRMQSHKSTFLALDTLNKISRLEVFELNHDLLDIVNRIIQSQFLNDNYINNGGFLPTYSFIHSTVEYQNFSIEFETTYYALRALELLADYLNLGNFLYIGFDVSALSTYILNQVEETASELYFGPCKDNEFDFTLENTYFGIYMLRLLNLYDLDDSKIKNFIIKHLDYTNIKNVYYSYLISELLDLNIYFEISSIQELIAGIFDSTFYEFYLSIERKKICHEALYWVCFMEKNFSNPDYADTNFFKDFNGEFTHATIIGVILIACPICLVYFSSKKMDSINTKKHLQFKKIKNS